MCCDFEDWNDFANTISFLALRAVTFGRYTPTCKDIDLDNYELEYEGYSPKVIFAATAVTAIAAVFSAVELVRSGKMDSFIELVTSNANKAYEFLLG